ISDKKNEVPKLLSMINNKAAESKTGNETTPTMAVINNAQTVIGSLVIDIPSVLRLITVTMYFNDRIKDCAINNAIEINHNVIPVPEPGIACSTADNGG